MSTLIKVPKLNQGNAVGGDHSNQVISCLNWYVIKNNQKIFISYSDATVLHLAFLNSNKNEFCIKESALR